MFKNMELVVKRLRYSVKKAEDDLKRLLDMKELVKEQKESDQRL